MESPVPPPALEFGPGCLALVQLTGEAALRSRVPGALARGEDVVARRVASGAAFACGEIVRSAARGWCVRFPEPQAALLFAAGLQEALLGEEWPGTLLARPEAAEAADDRGQLVFRGLRVRVAVHCGPVACGDGRVHGPAVEQVARLASAAHGGQVVATEEAWRRLRGLLPGSMVVRDLGPHRLTGVGGARRVFQVLPVGLDGRQFPDLASEGLRRTNVSPQEDFVGRQTDLAALTELTTLGVRLVSIVGPEGVGKARLCRQLAYVLRDDERLTGGVWIVTPLDGSGAALVRAVAQALSVGLGDAHTERDAIVKLGHALAARGRTLLVVEGLGATDASIAPVVDAWLDLARGLTLVVAAAQRLRTRGEVAYDLGPLSLPTGPDGARHADAVRMYAARARAVDADFQLGSGEEVGKLVRALAGHPLSIRLLAGVVDRLPLIGQLEALASLTTPGEVSSVAWDALDETERQVLALCALHTGSFEALELPPGLEANGIDVDDLLRQLDRRGWIRATPDPAVPGVRRYAMAPDVRASVARRLPAARLEGLRAHRDAALLRLCEPWGRRVRGQNRPEIIAHLALEWPNLAQVVREGTSGSAAPDELDVAARALLALGPVLLARGPLSDGLALADSVLKRFDEVLAADPVPQARALVLRASLLVSAGRGAVALQDLDRAESIAERWSDVDGRALCLLYRGRALWATGAHEPSLRALTASAEAFVAAGDPIGEGRALSWLGALEMGVGRYAEAEAHLQFAVASLREHGARFDEARALSFLALLLRRSERFDEARALYRAQICILAEEGEVAGESLARSDLALLDFHLGRPAEADEGLEEAAALARQVGDRRAEACAIGHGGLVALSRGELTIARDRLLRSLAVHRDLADVPGEGRDTGLLAILHHLSDQPEPARAFYRRSLELLGDAGERRLEALYSAWFAALEAETGDTAAARALYDIAMIKHAESADPQVGEALLQLRGAVDWIEAAQAEAQGAVGEAARLRRAARDRLEQVQARSSPLPAEARLAHLRVKRLFEASLSA